MIISREVKVRWNKKTKEHYINKGYEFNGSYNEFIVGIEDMYPGATQIVDVECDYCKTLYQRPYKFIYTSLQSSIINKWACKPCSPSKRIDENKERQKLGMLNRGDKGYWRFLENIEKELRSYINKYRTVDYISERDAELYQAIKEHMEGSLENLTTSLGYVWNEISSSVPVNYYRDFDNFKEKIDSFILNNNRFPLKNDIIKELGIQQDSIDFHGGMYEIKRKLKYSDTEDLIDDRGFINRSKLEFVTAQYLIANNIPYEREIMPFKEHQYRSDFLISTSNKEYYVEVWGYSENDEGRRAREYNLRKKIKIDLYNKYKLTLVSLEYDDMDMLSYKELQKYLKRKFSFLDEEKLEVFEEVCFLHPARLADKELLNEIMKHSKDNNILPLQSDLADANKNHYLTEVRKRYGDYYSFAKKFNKELIQKKNVWNLDTTYEAMLDIVNNKMPINKNTAKSIGYSGISNKFKRYFGSSGYTTPKLWFYEQYIDSHTYIHEDDLKLIDRISKINKAGIRYTVEDINKANSIMKKLSLHKAS